MALERERGEFPPLEEEILGPLTAELRRAVVQARRAVEEGVRAAQEACRQPQESRDKGRH